MIKTIKIKKCFTFRELLKYILENDIRDREFRSDEGGTFRVGDRCEFDFHVIHYNIGETYEVEVEEEITEDRKFESVVINTEDLVHSIRHASIKQSKNIPKAIEIFARIDGKLQKIWECE